MKARYLAPLAMFLAVRLFPQAPSAASAPLPPGFIDGSKTPSQIPDAVAFRLVFASLALSANATQQAIKAQDAHMKFIGLGDTDRGVLKRIVATFSADRANAQAPGVPPAVSDAQMASVVQTARDAVGSQLSANGATRFVQYVTLAKSRMIYHP